jgi:YggT family protein
LVATILRIVSLAFTAYSLLIILRALLPWFGVSYHHPAMRFLLQTTEPLLAPLRRVVPSTGGLDFTPMVALLVLWVVEWILTRLILMAL